MLESLLQMLTNHPIGALLGALAIYFTLRKYFFMLVVVGLVLVAGMYYKGGGF